MIPTRQSFGRRFPLCHYVFHFSLSIFLIVPWSFARHCTIVPLDSCCGRRRPFLARMLSKQRFRSSLLRLLRQRGRVHWVSARWYHHWNSQRPLKQGPQVSLHLHMLFDALAATKSPGKRLQKLLLRPAEYFLVPLVLLPDARSAATAAASPEASLQSPDSTPSSRCSCCGRRLHLLA
jgi:hypothetical protein